MNYILTIDTTNPDKTAILLAMYPYTSGITLRECKDGCVRILVKKIWRAKTHQSEELLPEIDKLLKKNKIKTENLGLIIVCIGPGSFTGIRVGVATANAMAFGLDIPVIGVKSEFRSIEKIAEKGLEIYRRDKIKRRTMVKPFYDKAPNITTPKNK